MCSYTQYDNIMHEFEKQLASQPDGDMKDFVWKRMHQVEKDWEESQNPATQKKSSK